MLTTEQLQVVETIAFQPYLLSINFLILVRLGLISQNVYGSTHQGVHPLSGYCQRINFIPFKRFTRLAFHSADQTVQQTGNGVVAIDEHKNM
jgi:hypothetical protein